jgi:threonine aldolase
MSCQSRQPLIDLRSDTVTRPDQATRSVMARRTGRPDTTLPCLENTRDTAGGAVTPVDEHRELIEAARSRGPRIRQFRFVTYRDLSHVDVINVLDRLAGHLKQQ